MYSITFTSLAAAIAVFTTGGVAYKNNCEGSSNSPNLSVCQQALNNINPGITYKDQAQFSVGDCYVVYATIKNGDHPLSGRVIKDTAKAILDNCGHHKGSFGTNNCDSCHVTINYRKAP